MRRKEGNEEIVEISRKKVLEKRKENKKIIRMSRLAGRKYRKRGRK